MRRSNNNHTINKARVTVILSVTAILSETFTLTNEMAPVEVTFETMLRAWVELKNSGLWRLHLCTINSYHLFSSIYHSHSVDMQAALGDVQWWHLCLVPYQVQNIVTLDSLVDDRQCPFLHCDICCMIAEVLCTRVKDRCIALQNSDPTTAIPMRKASESVAQAIHLIYDICWKMRNNTQCYVCV